MKKNQLSVFLPIIIAVSISVGMGLNSYFNNTSTNEISFFPTNTVNTNSKIKEILSFIENTYVDSVDKDELTENSIAAILSQLDPHSYYIPKTDFNAMTEPLEGNFEGIGIEFRIKNDTVIVISPIANGPSEKLGIKAGDRIVHVDSVNIAGIGITNQEVIKYLKGPRGTKVNVLIKRKGIDELLLFSITRGTIPILSVDSPYMINDTTGYVKLSRFAKNTYLEFVEATKMLQEQGMKNLIIDLRGNGGGMLSAAIKIADEILATNKMIVYTDGRVRKKEEYFSTKQGSLENTPVVILINENSASASEILAGAIQDNDRGQILGRRSFGKGLVQEQIVWPDGSAIRLTVSRYYTPTGRCIQKPYDGGSEQYHLEAYERYKSGELLSSDSIPLMDSLKYYTPAGKVVYGGGGIIPDIFVPLDTTGNTNYIYEMRYRGVLQDFALNYVDGKRKQLIAKYKDPVLFRDYFVIQNDLFNSALKYAHENGIERNLEEIQLSKKLIKQELKAYIGRNLWNDLGYYIVANKNDKTVQKALESFK